MRSNIEVGLIAASAAAVLFPPLICLKAKAHRKWRNASLLDLLNQRKLANSSPHTRKWTLRARLLRVRGGQ
jgi:hypothetical protein